MQRPKVALMLREGLLAWQELNVASFLISGVAATHPELIGKPYEDADGQPYLALLGYPVAALVGDAQQLANSRRRAIDRGLPISVYTQEMFETGNDVDNRAVVAAVPGDRLDLVGIALAGERNTVDKITKGATLHP